MGIYQRKGAWNVEAYDPARKRNVYVGRCKLKADAKELLRVKTAELKAAARADGQVEKVTVDTYAERWLTIKHGPGTRRPAESTRRQNRAMLKAFRAQFGDRLVDGGVQRREALDWAIGHQQQAKAASAMWNDAIDDEHTTVNPLANRRHQQPRGRRDINPLTEREVLMLEEIALDRWGRDAYGLIVRAWIRFGAWVGSRPGETFAVELQDLDMHRGEVTVRRVKKRGNQYPVDVVALPDVVMDAITAMPNKPPSGPLFRTVDGKPLAKGALRYYWDPVRSAFQAQVTPERWRELLAGQKNQESLDFYSLRHYCASIIVDRGGNEFDVSAQLGNSPEVARETYIHAYRDRVNDRNRSRLNGPAVTDLDEARRRRDAG